MKSKIIIFVIAALVIFFGILIFKKLLSPAPTVNEASVTYKKEDIDKDEKVDTSDEDFVIKQLNCQKSLPCWNKVIGKTLNGDNPIYTFDLDMNADGVINQLDVDQIKNAK
jgi:hypothetical protein